MKEKRMKDRNAFTLVELLVVIAIIGILIALLLPAVQSVREAARRMQCSNNLKQIGLALHNYNTTIGAFPTNKLSSGAYGSNKRSWMQWILPYIEQQNLFDQIDLDAGFENPGTGNSIVAETAIEAYLCPSDGDTKGGKLDKRADAIWNNGAACNATFYGVTNYQGVAGSNWCWSSWRNDDPPAVLGGTPCDGHDFGNGWVCRNLGSEPIIVRSAKIRDGLTNTFAIGEALPSKAAHTSWYYPNNTWSTAAIPLNWVLHNQVDPEWTGWADNQGFASYHPGGASFCLFDGSVTFISNDIDTDTYRSAASLHGGEVAQIHN